METYKFFNPEAEQAVLGAILLEGDLIQECTLLPQHFSPGNHQLIFTAMRDLDEKSQSIDLVTVMTQLGEYIRQIGGVSYLSNLTYAVPTTANFGIYQQLIIDSYKLRETRNLAFQLVGQPDQVSEYLQKFTQLLEMDLARARTTKDILADIYQDIGTDVVGLAGIDTGINSMNDMTGGLQNGDLIIIAARPSVGKTAFALNLAMNHCSGGGFTTFFSLEMQDKQLIQRMLSAVAHVNAAKWRNPSLLFTEEDHVGISKAMGFIDKWKLDIEDSSDQSIFTIRSAVRKNIRQHPDQKHFVIIDYLQLIRIVGKAERHDLAIGQITKALKNMAREFNIPVVLLSQLSRGVEQRKDKRPMMSDIRDSGSVEQDADIVCFLYRDDYYNKETEQKHLVEVILAKHRNGPVGTIELAFIKEYGKFMELRWKQ